MIDLPSDLDLQRERIHLFLVDMDSYFPQADDLGSLLNETEMNRAERFVFDVDRRRFIVARAWLRRLLASYLAISPQFVKLSYNVYGKPFAENENGLSFNLSHSGHLALFAVCRDAEIGVDIEQVKPEIATLEIAQKFFAPKEVQLLKGVPTERRSELFFDCWTQKEAYIKAKGMGLSLDLHSFAVNFQDDDPRLLFSDHHPDDVEKFTIFKLSVPHPFKAAVASSIKSGAKDRYRRLCYLEAS
ncbi:MAG: 4'-phosphopantetheinyl transferase superfamily protein [Calditrichaeota bacterium]|nr:MAG: 4'-phosphopantetheinyl transferase superfamily protein [Calditrichota bacterium]